ncbi:MAG TPA: alanine--tRNA ligase [Firmicutes bacterium]|jgi:alanyl-tRNA synthetase|nr:alanine--tRNA ligase [Bacillota bacterium]
MKIDTIRTIFLNFFQEKEHLVLPSFPLIPQNDPSLLLIGAGMAPLKPFFTGEKTPPHRRVATCQKCVRTPDIDQVGFTPRHATFFEMLGNFSFGDYFKEEAIFWAWELLTEHYHISEEKLFISVYEDDDESLAIWRDKIGVPATKIHKLGKDDNFWEIGEGPCGPCSEIYYDLGPEYGCGSPNCQVGCDCDRYMEVWNLVFTQFNRDAAGNYEQLKQKNIDTGMGLERLAVVLQGVSNIFEIDNIKPLLDYFADKAGVKYGQDGKTDTALRVITEHMRGTTFLVADRILPSNEGRGYVLRRLLRRAIRYGKLLGMEIPFLYRAVPLLADLMGDAYPEIKKDRDYITRVIRAEEERFAETLGQGMDILEEEIALLKKEGKTTLGGGDAFKLYDTFGFPLDLTREILREHDLGLDEPGFDAAMEQQKSRGRTALGNREQHSEIPIPPSILNEHETKFVGYDVLQTESEVLALVTLPEGKTLQSYTAKDGEEKEICLLLDKTPFYAEKGGQVGDTGFGETPRSKVSIKNTLPGPSEGQILHIAGIKNGTIATGDRIRAKVDEKRRKDIARNHTATHLLQQALKDLLGDHVSQAGSLVTPDRLRFDFTHYSGLTGDEIAEIEKNVNEAILRDMLVETTLTDVNQAMEMGAIALFDEKYGETVRVVQIEDYSRELCGGTHVSQTGEIGLFKIISEGSVGSGVRRIEALTGREAYQHLSSRDKLLQELADLLKTTPEKSKERLQDLLESQRELQRKIKQMQQAMTGMDVDNLLQKIDNSLGIPVLSAQVEAENMETLREYLDHIRGKLPSGIIFLGTVSGGKVLLAAAITKDLNKEGLHAGKLVGEIAKLTGGGGGGRPDLAQAGGKDPDKLPHALSQVLPIIKKQRAGSSLK